MNWTRFLLAVLASGCVSSLTDWLFMGDFVYKRFGTHPEIWRVRDGVGESKAIAWSSPLPFLTCGVFAFLCVHLHLIGYRSTFEFALALWLVAPVPMLIVNAIWMKVSPPITALYAVGWLVKLLVAALCVAVILG